MQLGVEARDRPGRGVHQDQRLDPLRMPQRDPAGDHAAHRVAEQPEAVEADRVGDRERVGDEPVERVRGRIVGLVALAVAAVVEHDDRVVARPARGT